MSGRGDGLHPSVAGAQPYMLAGRQGAASSDEPLFASDEGRERLEKVLSRYPSKRPALLPLLGYAQERNGWVSGRAMQEIAEALDLTPAYVHSVATFYTMYNRRPVGRYLVQVCTNISCHLNRGEEVLERFLEETGTRPGETSEDGLFTVMEVECLGACGFATVVQVNDEYVENVSPDAVAGIVSDLRERAAEDGA
ncbi:MAG TPA: NAD(P)H-dependent oxidoreductase subunit E [Gemmatimonadota bacterium]|nr:NAD(P)H-dependent oxidoreductase subunit E [Gemmatimonadota bacterium]